MGPTRLPVSSCCTGADIESISARLRDALSGDLAEYAAIFVDDDLLNEAADVILAELRQRAADAGVVVVASSQRDDQSLLSRYEAADDWLWRPVTANRIWLSLAHLAGLRQ